jgi:hypothetical protein
MPKALSGRALAKALNVSDSTVREYLKREDWPVKRRSAPWPAADVATIAAWRTMLQEDRSRSVEPETGPDGRPVVNVDRILKTARAKLVTAQYKRLEGSLVDRRLLDAALEALAKTFVKELEEAERALPQQLAGREPGEVERVLHDRFRSMRESLAGRKMLELENVELALKAANDPQAKGRPAGRR